MQKLEIKSLQRSIKLKKKIKVNECNFRMEVTSASRTKYSLNISTSIVKVIFQQNEHSGKKESKG